MKMNIVVLLSGGMDSVTCLYHAMTEHNVVGAVSFDYGARHASKELACAKYHCASLNIPHYIIPLKFISELWKSALLPGGDDIPEGHYAEETMKKTVVPFRNGIMLTISAGLAESIEGEAIAIAAHAGDHSIYPDCREVFMKVMSEAIQLGTYREIMLIRPFISLTKANIASRGYELGVDYKMTWSCYKGEELHCGVCGTCVERREAFILAQLPDPTKYAATPPLPSAPLASSL